MKQKLWTQILGLKFLLSPVSADLILIKVSYVFVAEHFPFLKETSRGSCKNCCCIPDGLYGKEEQHISYWRSIKNQTSFALIKEIFNCWVVHSERNTLNTQRLAWCYNGLFVSCGSSINRHLVVTWNKWRDWGIKINRDLPNYGTEQRDAIPFCFTVDIVHFFLTS